MGWQGACRVTAVVVATLVVAAGCGSDARGGSGGGGSSGDAGRDASDAGGARAGGEGGHVAEKAGQGGAPAAAAGGGAAGRAGSGGDGGAGGRAAAGAGASGASGVAGHAAAGGGGASSAPSGASLCADGDLWFCDGFEGDAIDSSAWKAMQTLPSLDTAHVARGAKSLHMHTTATGASGITITKIFSSAMGHYYGRLFVWFDALPTLPQWAHWTIVGANPKQGEMITGENRVGGQFDGKINRWGVGTDGGPTGDWTNLDGDPSGHVENVAGGRWYCVEWLHDWDQDVSKLYIDGVEHPSLDTTADVKHQGNANTKYEIPVLGSVWVGFWNYDQHQTVTPDHFDVWIDEVAFDDERIGCDR